jgi:hypothetical protein
MNLVAARNLPSPQTAFQSGAAHPRQGMLCPPFLTLFFVRTMLSSAEFCDYDVRINDYSQIAERAE